MLRTDTSCMPRSGQRPLNMAELVEQNIAEGTRLVHPQIFQQICGVMVSGGINQNTSLHRISAPPYYDARYLLKVHHIGTTAHPEQRTQTELSGMEHARMAFNKWMPGNTLVPETYYWDTEASIIAMEFAHGKLPSKKAVDGWSDAQKTKYIRRMAVIRLMLLGLTAGHIGAPVVDENGRLGVGEFSGLLPPFNLRRNYLDDCDRGPFKFVLEFARAGLMKEIIFFTRHHQGGHFWALPHWNPLDEFPATWEDWIEYLNDLLNWLPEGRGFNEPEDPKYFFTHGDLIYFNNMLVRGSTVSSIIDWETASYLPFSESISDLTREFYEGDNAFDSEDWREHVARTGDAQYFTTSLNPRDESLEARLTRYDGANHGRQEHRNWEAIGNVGGPLFADDFEDCIVDEEGDAGAEGVDKYDDSENEIDLYEPEEPNQDRYRNLCDQENYWIKDFYSRPIWALMREYINRGGDRTGDIPFPAKIKHPLAHWRDRVLRLAMDDMETNMRDRLVPPGYQGCRMG